VILDLVASRFWLCEQPLVLASGSSTRRQILKQVGIVCDVDAANIDERATEGPLIKAGASGSAVALGLAGAKALAVSKYRPGRIVLGADQTLTCDSRFFHKPGDRAGAEEQLRQLSGRSHQLHSAVELMIDGQTIFERVETSVLTMRQLDDAFISSYLEAVGDSVFTSVGCYRIEGLGPLLFDDIRGEHTAILGLPIFPLLAFFREKGYIIA
jgi:septum formation protein